MEGDKRQRTRPSQQGHQQRSFTHTTPHQQNESGHFVNTPSLDHFLSGIKYAECNTDSAKTSAAQLNAPPTVYQGMYQGPALPGPLTPGSLQWDSYMNANEKPMWQILHPGSRAGQMQPVSTESKHLQSHPPLGSRQHSQDTINDFHKRDSVVSATTLQHKSGTTDSQRKMQQYPVQIDRSSRQKYDQEQHNLSSSRERPRPLASTISSENVTNQPQTNFQGHHFPGTHPPSDKPFIPHFQQNQESHQPGPRPSGPHSFGHPGEFCFPPPTQPFHPLQEHQEQNQLDSNFQRPHPVVPHPKGPHPPGSHHLQPHPSNSIHSGPPPNHPAPQQLQQGVAHDPFSLEPNHLTPPHLALPSHFQNRQCELMQQSQQHWVTVQDKSQREKDEDWLQEWVRKNKIGQSKRTGEKKIKSITVYNGRQLVAELLQALRQLRDQKDMLSRHINREESMWQYECRRAFRSKERVEMLQERLFSKEVVVQLHSTVKKLGKKRTRLKRRKLENYQRQQDVEARRKETHLKIDEELAKRLHKEQEKKKEAELQEEVDKTLYEVRKKKHDISQALDLIKGLRKLRELRKVAAQSKGVYTTRDLDINFDKKLKPHEELMSKQSTLYREEERVMQVMLEEEHEEYKEQEKKRQRKRLEEKTIKEMQAKMKLLFGKDDLVRPDDPIFHFQQFYHQADNNVHALLDIRRQWDQFLVPEIDQEGSPVPVSWVLPSNPSCSAWASVLDT